MKNYKSTIIALFTIALMIGINSCEEGDPMGFSSNIFDAPEFYVPELDNSPAEIIDATLENDFRIISENNDYRLNKLEQMGKMGQRKRRHFMRLREIFGQLELDDTQKEQLKEFIYDLRICMREAIMQLRDTEKDALESMRAARTEIIEKYKNGELTRQEAMQAIRQLAREVRELMMNNPEREKTCEAMKECRDLFFEQIASILNEEQLIKWNAWLDSMTERDCSGDK